MTREEDYLNRICTLVDEYRLYESDELDYYEDYISVPNKIEQICGVSTDMIESQGVYYLIDTLREILVNYGFLPHSSKVLDDESINISDCTNTELVLTLDNIIDKLTSLLYDKHVLN